MANDQLVGEGLVRGKSDSISYLVQIVGQSRAEGLSDWLSNAHNARRRPFDTGVKSALARFSKWLLDPNNHGANGAYMALGFWLRPAAIAEQERSFEANTSSKLVATPRGLAFHLPPTNVETIFIYSLALSMLCGNVNICRLPSQLSETTRILLKHFVEALVGGDVDGMCLFVTYDLQTNVTAELSKLSDLRIIWGGDAKVQSISTLPQKPRGVTVGFPDRYSYSVLNAATYGLLDEKARNALASAAYNDIFLFDQMGCSSTQVQYWVGKKEQVTPLARDFTARISIAAASKGYEMGMAGAATKLTQAMGQVLDGPVGLLDTTDMILIGVHHEQPRDLRDSRGGAGMVGIIHLNSVMELAELVQERDQTLATFGFDVETLHELAIKINGRGIDRMVPIGQALQFDRIWDGQDLLRSFSRLVTIS
ncbi:acyl-CoA reductase [Aquidulcibacter sp.]|uniref:acyl-CoA reductase n=1 Tax=Aquidulcibacter sp. TaxID=2052990 RepID=UPI0025BFD7B5|nr:acyl-CoA reductase [Aquidulcibacter sp.]MCA3692982.1 hypothetical protein [Aquidulcibacter sp.]